MDIWKVASFENVGEFYTFGTVSRWDTSHKWLGPQSSAECVPVQCLLHQCERSQKCWGALCDGIEVASEGLHWPMDPGRRSGKVRSTLSSAEAEQGGQRVGEWQQSG